MQRKIDNKPEQLNFSFSVIQNHNFLSSHWIEHRLPLEPEWEECDEEVRYTLNSLIELWDKEHSRVEKYGNEPALEHAFIQPVLKILGWHSIYQPFLQNRKPDYALFRTEESSTLALDTDRKSADFWKFPSLVADAKAWHVNLDKPIRTKSIKEFPPEQIEWYLDRSRLNYGILTNGWLWRLVPREIGIGNPRFQTYLQVDLKNVLDKHLSRQKSIFDAEDIEEFKKFYLFFSPWAYREDFERSPLIERARSGSSEYRLGVSEDLKEQVFEALRICIEGFLQFKQNNLSPQKDLSECRTSSLVFLYRLLFVMFAEDRGLLPYRINALYSKNHSLARTRDYVASRLDNIKISADTDYSKDDTNIWEDLNSLFDLINSGKKQYGVGEYNGGLFNSNKHKFLSNNFISDWYLARVIDQLSRAPGHAKLVNDLFRVDYRDLAIQHLGSIYEGLLELKPAYAKSDLIVIRSKKNKALEKYLSSSDKMPRGYERTNINVSKGSVYLKTDKNERRAYGSYYTPDHIVDHIVKNTLSPLCNEINEELIHEIEECKKNINNSKNNKKDYFNSILNKLESDFDDRVLKLRILDPSMGSAHFLVRACSFLAEEIATNPYTADEEADKHIGDEPILSYWKRRVAESCIYGVDINPMAVELAKVALWLETAQAGPPLGFLDHHLLHGNSLIGGRINMLSSLPKAPAMFESLYKDKVSNNIKKIIDPLLKIQEIKTSSAKSVKKKEALYNNKFLNLVTTFKKVSDIWCAYFFADTSRYITQEEYADLIEKIDSKSKTQSEETIETILTSVDDANKPFCQWELEFPNVYYDKKGERDDAGFDAIIGNPPYDVLAEKELGRDLSSLKSYIEYIPIYQPSIRGKNNLYKLFICLSFDLLKDGGYLGLIVPMTLLGDIQAVGIRKLMFDGGRFMHVHSFPQKDDKNKRVFRDAKLSTAVFVSKKTSNSNEVNEEFKCSVHPGNFIEETSRCLDISRKSIQLYDPENYSIVSCSQEDWDIATKLFLSGRCKRLGDYCESFQGEINETTDRKKGNIEEVSNKELPILRGANVCLYAIRDASQGETLFLNKSSYLFKKKHNSKAYHHKEQRLGWQRKSPQNNFRRIISTLIEPGRFCFDSVNYIPESKSKFSLHYLMALLNSKFLDWYFRLGSTNSSVNEYQFKNLPCFIFDENINDINDMHINEIMHLIENDQQYDAVMKLKDNFKKVPFDINLLKIIEASVCKIIDAEDERGEIARSERSNLSRKSQPYQEFLDILFFNMAGLNNTEILTIEDSLEKML